MTLSELHFIRDRTIRDRGTFSAEGYHSKDNKTFVEKVFLKNDRDYFILYNNLEKPLLFKTATQVLLKYVSIMVARYKEHVKDIYSTT
ncbi:MAG: hypothetical protein IIB06_08985 [Bacteroidetes bacterium]|nr:hypothetical protein [Bacteroidota bacterium]